MLKLKSVVEWKYWPSWEFVKTTANQIAQSQYEAESQYITTKWKLFENGSRYFEDLEWIIICCFFNDNDEM